MQLTKPKLQQPARQKAKSPAKPAKTKSTASTSLKNSEPQQAASKKKMSKPHQNVPSAFLGGTTPTTKSADSEELLQVHSLLVQIWYRNKNQHRTQKWWKWVSILKRAVRDLVELVVGAGEEEKSGAEELDKAARFRKRMEATRVRREKREQLEMWLREVVVGRCWLAFSTLIADRQFSNLGVVLLAILARVGKLVGLPEPAPPAVSDIKPGQQAHNILATSLNQTGVDRGEVVKRVSPMSDMEAAAEADTVRPLTKELSGEERQKRRLTTGNVEGESLGQDTHPDKASESLLGVTDMGDDDDAAARAYAPGVRGIKSKASHQLASGVVAHNTSSASSDKTPATPERKKKRRKKGNAIDELFAGLS